jgi:AcrR family transcriptional regulator
VPPTTPPADEASATGSIWSRPERRTRGPRPEHSRAEIVAAAIALADSGGLGAASMRAIAGALGTAAASLYRYLSSRDDLLDLMADAALSEVQFPEPSGHWLDDLVDVARQQRALHRRHPWLMEASLRPTALGPRSLDHFERCLRIMAPLTCPSAAKFEAIAMITGIAHLFARNDAASNQQAVSPARLFTLLDPGAHPTLAAALTGPTAAAPETDLFERTIRSVLRGLLLDAETG